MTQVELPSDIMCDFVEALSTEIGHDTFSAVLSKAGLPEDWALPEHFIGLDNTRAAQAYARLQSALRTYYGRGARGILLRIDSKLWERMLDDSSLGVKAQAGMVRWLPTPLKRKQALDLLARILSARRGDLTTHTLDLDLLLVDQASPTTLSQSDESPICFVTLGLIRECLYWATGEEHDIEERACRAAGARQCEFKITIGE